MESIAGDATGTNHVVASQNSQTASQYIDEQLALEADAKEILPYKFDKFYTPAGVCYGCSISCHGDHNLVELFKRRNFVCDCGTTRMPDTSPCMLRSNPETGRRGVSKQEAAKDNKYNHNYQNQFCGCGEEYDPETEKGTMYQCMGLASVDAGGCGEDWWHPECLMGLPRDWATKGLAKPRVEKKVADQEDADAYEHAVPDGFPYDDEFSNLICYKCVESNAWIKQYAGTEGFLAPVYKHRSGASSAPQSDAPLPSLKRKASDDGLPRSASPSKRVKEEKEIPSAVLGESNTATLEAEDTTSGDITQTAAAVAIGPPSTSAGAETKQKHESLPPAPRGTFSILTKEDFRDHFCHCPQCFPNLIPHPYLQEEEDEYEPSLSDSEESQPGRSGTRSVGTGSLLERGEAALSAMDRVKAIEGVMVYNHLKDKVKEFLKPYAESGQAVSAEDIKGYFEKLRGDQDAMKEASKKPVAGDDDDGAQGDNRREQSGY